MVMRERDTDVRGSLDDCLSPSDATGGPDHCLPQPTCVALNSKPSLGANVIVD